MVAWWLDGVCSNGVNDGAWLWGFNGGWMVTIVVAIEKRKYKEKEKERLVNEGKKKIEKPLGLGEAILCVAFKTQGFI